MPPKIQQFNFSGQPTNLLTEYFKVFGQKPCCFFDLRPYMSLLQGKLVDEFLKELNEIVDLKEGEFPKSVSVSDIYLFNSSYYK